MSIFEGRTGQALNLVGHPKRTLLRSIEMLRAMMAPTEIRNVRLGGGTALAMRWGHRHSTDIDYAMNADLARSFIGRARNDLRRELARMAAEGEIKRSFRVGAHSASWTYADSGPVSLSATRASLETDGMGWEADTGTPMAPVDGILRGKLVGRVIHGSRLLARDGYDLCCMFRHAPDVAEVLVQEAIRDHEQDFERIIETILESSTRIFVGRPLKGAAHTDLAREPWRSFAELVSDVLRPPAPQPTEPAKDPESPTPKPSGCP